MILIVSSSAAARQVSSDLAKTCGEKALHVTTLKDFASALRDREYKLIVMDQLFADMNPKSMDLLWKNCGGAVPLFPNFALAKVSRILDDCKAGLERRERERANAFKDVSQTLRSELTGTVTGILLSSELALAEPELPRTVQARLRSVRDLAFEIKTRLNIHA